MLNSKLNLDGSVVHRISFFFRSILALLAGHFISISGETQPFKELFKLPGYWPALISSIVIAFIAIEQVNFSTIRLHQRFPMYDKGYIKLKRQLVFCFILPFVTVFGLALTYYAYHGYFILDTLWVTNHGLQILLMLLILNLLFGITRITETKDVIKLKPLPDSEGLEREIVYVTHDKGINKVYDKNGAFTLDIRPLKELIKILDQQLYIFNPQNCIIRRDNIRYVADTSKGKLRVELISPATFVEVSGRQRRLYLGYFK